MRSVSVLLACLGLLAFASCVSARPMSFVWADEPSQQQASAVHAVLEAQSAHAEAEHAQAQAALAQHTATNTMSFSFDDSAEQHVMVEAASGAESTPPALRESVDLPNIAGNPVNKAQLLPVSRATDPNAKPMTNTFLSQPPTPAKPEGHSVTAPRLQSAKYHIARMAHAEEVAEYQQYKQDLAKHKYTEAIKKSRQSEKFLRPVWNEPQQPAVDSHSAALRNDRVSNTLFPAATVKSDGKAPSQYADFHHRGDGDHNDNHAIMLQHSEYAAQEPETAIDPNAGKSAAAVGAKPKIPAESIAAASEPVAIQEPVEATESDVAAVVDNAPKDPAKAASPCEAQCEGAGLWRTAPCQDCIVRGMVNGWIVRSITDGQRGFNYAHAARNQCVKYANDLHARSSQVQGAPFAHCFFHKMHETCNL